MAAAKGSAEEADAVAVTSDCKVSMVMKGEGDILVSLLTVWVAAVTTPVVALTLTVMVEGVSVIVERGDREMRIALWRVDSVMSQP